MLQEDGESEPLHTGRIVPIYERTGSRHAQHAPPLVLRALEAAAGAAARTAAGGAWSRASGWPDRRTALRQAHFPDPDTSVEALNACATPAQQRLIFEDFFVYQTGLALRRRQNAARAQAARHRRRRHAARAARAQVLPFKLTAGQRDGRARHRRRHAAPLADAAAAAGRRRVGQDAWSRSWRRWWRWRTATRWRSWRRPSCSPSSTCARSSGWLFGTALPRRPADRPHDRRRPAPRCWRDDRRRRRPAGRRHARAGAGRRRASARWRWSSSTSSIASAWCSAGLLAEKGLHPDVLLMTATPIPRTLALTACGDMDVSVMRDRPPGRQPVRTMVRRRARRDEVYGLMRDGGGRRAGRSTSSIRSSRSRRRST